MFPPQSPADADQLFPKKKHLFGPAIVPLPEEKLLKMFGREQLVANSFFW